MDVILKAPVQHLKHGRDGRFFQGRVILGRSLNAFPEYSKILITTVEIVVYVFGILLLIPGENSRLNGECSLNVIKYHIFCLWFMNQPWIFPKKLKFCPLVGIAMD